MRILTYTPAHLTPLQGTQEDELTPEERMGYFSLRPMDPGVIIYQKMLIQVSFPISTHFPNSHPLLFNFIPPLPANINRFFMLPKVLHCRPEKTCDGLTQRKGFIGTSVHASYNARRRIPWGNFPSRDNHTI